MNEKSPQPHTALLQAITENAQESAKAGSASLALQYAQAARELAQAWAALPEWAQLPD